MADLTTRFVSFMKENANLSGSELKDELSHAFNVKDLRDLIKENNWNTSGKSLTNPVNNKSNLLDMAMAGYQQMPADEIERISSAAVRASGSIDDVVKRENELADAAGRAGEALEKQGAAGADGGAKPDSFDAFQSAMQ